MKKQFIDLFLLSLVFFMALSPLVKAEETLFDEPPPPFLPPFPYDDFEKPTILDENGEPITGVKKEWFENGENYVMDNPYMYGLYTSDNVDTSFSEGIYEGVNNPQNYEWLVGKPASTGLSITDYNKEPDDRDVTHYYAGETIDISVRVPIDMPYYKQVDLWVIIKLPSGDFLYKVDDPFNPFVFDPQTAFMKSIQNVDETYQILQYPVSSNINGNFTIYVFFNKEKSGLEHFFSTIKSNIAVFKFTIISDF